jgi:hypothetical protein
VKESPLISIGALLRYYVLSSDDAGERLHSLAELGIEELPGFLRWLFFEVAEGGSEDETD